MTRKVGLFLMCGVVLPLVLAATASAQVDVTCQDCANPKEPEPGKTVKVESFGGFSGTGGTIYIRLDTRSGRVLKATAPDPRGSVNTEFTWPENVDPGWHLFVITQPVESSGRDRGFTPLRARVRAQSASASAAAPGGGGNPPGPPLGLLAMGSALLALLLLATGPMVTRRLRTLNRPQLGS